MVDFVKTCYITCKKICWVDINQLLLQRYPEYNLFTLKRLIPIEIGALRCEARGIRFFIGYSAR
jgi:hypothetical protein